MTTQLATRSRPAITRARAEHERGSGSAVSDLSRRITSIRSEAFELVERLNAAGGRHAPELEDAGWQMQSIANQLGTIQALIQSHDAA
jgi:hypothetical protein